MMRNERNFFSPTPKITEFSDGGKKKVSQIIITNKILVLCFLSMLTKTNISVYAEVWGISTGKCTDQSFHNSCCDIVEATV